MKLLVLMLALASSTFCNAFVTKGIYGVDDRLDMYVSDGISRTLGRSVVAKIGSRHFLDNKDGSYTITGQNLKDKLDLCEGERFSTQVSAASCSGFLVAPDLIVTAGHCMMNDHDCSSSNWVFDYSLENEGSPITISKDNIYKCKKIEKHAYENDSAGFKRDFAIIRLDRSVIDREPLKIRTSGEVKRGTSLMVIGFPDGTPMKVAENGFVRSVGKNIFRTNLDTFFKNSGSPVINSETYEVEGILVDGDTDYFYDEENRCMRIQTFDMKGGLGEGVYKISKATSLRELLK